MKSMKNGRSLFLIKHWQPCGPNHYLWPSRASSAAAKVADVTASAGTTRDKEPLPFSDVPGPKGNTVLRFIKTFSPYFGKYKLDERYQYFLDLQRKYGNVVREEHPFFTMVNLFDPRDIQTVFHNQGKMPNRPPMESLYRFRKSHPDVYKHPGLLTINGEEWYTLRRKLQNPMLRLDAVDVYCDSMAEVAKDFTDHIASIRNANNEVDDLLPSLYKWALESIGLVVFNNRMGCLGKDATADSEGQKLIGAVTDTFNALDKLEIGLQSWRLFPTPNYRKMANAQLYIARYIKVTLDRVKNLPADSKERVMLLVKLLAQEDISFEDVVVMVNDMLFAGVDTNAAAGLLAAPIRQAITHSNNALLSNLKSDSNKDSSEATSHAGGMTLYHLGNNRDVQEKLFKEIQTVLPSRNTPITPETLKQIPYLKAVIKETLRISPITDGNARILTKDIVVSGYKIPANTMIILHSRYTGLVNFPEAERFMPERWLRAPDGGSTAAAGSAGSTHPFNYVPFGYGMRMCIGRRFAEQELYLMIMKIIQRYRVEYHYDEIKMKSRIINVPDKAIRLSFIDR